MAKTLNDEQLAVVDHLYGPLLAAAVAGSGKTEAVVRRMARLVERGVDPRRILAVTFSRKAAREMEERLIRLLGKAAVGRNGARVGTFHSVAREILLAELPEYETWTVDSGGKYRLCLKTATGWGEMDWKEADITVLESYVSLCMCDLAVPSSPRAREIAEKIFHARGKKRDAVPEKLVQAYARAEEIRRDRLLLTFDAMLAEAVLLLRDSPGVRERWAAKWDFVIADEGQDSNRAQIDFGSFLGQDHRNYMLVGDPGQCHPAGTMILTDHEEVAIEHLMDSDAPFTVKGWNRPSQKMVGGRRFQIARRYYTGAMHTLQVAERSVQMTSNHKMLARWVDRSIKHCVTYLMWRKGYGYRVGWCQLFARRGPGDMSFHLAQRAKLEKADKVWILKIHTNRTDASVYESIVSARFGIPTAPFEPVNGAQHLTAESIRAIFDGVSTDNSDNGDRALRSHNREVEHPLWPWPSMEGDAAVAYRRSTYFPVYACNVEPELMAVPLPDGVNRWEPVRANEIRAVEQVPVYSLNVDKDHSYAANGVVVLNCIYSWRGARPERLVNFKDDWPEAQVVQMDRNYRCGDAIIAVANNVLRAMDPSTRLPMEMVACRGVPGLVEGREYMDFDTEAGDIAARIQAERTDGRKLSDYAVLYRTQAQSRALEEAFLAARIPYVLMGGVNFYERAEVADLLAYLRIATQGGTGEAMTRSLHKPFRFLGKAFLQRVEGEVEAVGSAGYGPTDIVRRVVAQGAGLQARQKASALEWCGLVEEVGRRASIWEKNEAAAKESGMPASLLEFVITRTGYTDWLRKEEGDESPENSRVSNVRELVRVASKFRTTAAFLAFVDETVAAAKAAAKANEKIDAVQCVTLHSSKGLEWPTVFLIGANEKVLPHARAEDLGEERRLFYVGVTRARDRLFVSYVQQAAVGNKVVFMAPSRFITEGGIPLIAEPNPKPEAQAPGELDPTLN